MIWKKFFDNVPQDKLMSLVHNIINDGDTESLIRKYLKAGVMVQGRYEKTDRGTPQGGNLSPLLSNIMLNELDRELTRRGHRFVRYADDCVIAVRSEASAKRVMYSITDWIQRKLGLKVNAEKTKITRPGRLKYLGFGFYKDSKAKEWKCRPHRDSVEKFKWTLKKLTNRSQSMAFAVRVQRLNWVIRGWINYFKIGSMKNFIDEFGQWLRHKIRCIVIKQWKKPMTIYRNLRILNIKYKSKFSEEEIYKCANTRLGWYRRSGLDVVNFILSPKVLSKEKRDRPGLVNPLNYYLKSL